MADEQARERPAGVMHVGKLATAGARIADEWAVGGQAPDK
jgi:hypothetical protein